MLLSHGGDRQQSGGIILASPGVFPNLTDYLADGYQRQLTAKACLVAHGDTMPSVGKPAATEDLVVIPCWVSSLLFQNMYGVTGAQATSYGVR